MSPSFGGTSFEGRVADPNAAPVWGQPFGRVGVWLAGGGGLWLAGWLAGWWWSVLVAGGGWWWLVDGWRWRWWLVAGGGWYMVVPGGGWWLAGW